MMKFLFSIIFVLTIAMAGKAEPGDNWPWGAEMPFPWKGIQGTWAFYVNNELTYIGLRTIRTTRGTNQLEMTMYQGKTCRELSSGAGFEEENIVRGMMLYPKGYAHMVTIHVFSDETMKQMNGQDWKPSFKRSKTYTVLNLSTVDYDSTETYELQKVHYSPYGICPQKKR